MVIDLNVGGSSVGYGLEYADSVMERLRLAALAQNDKMTQELIEAFDMAEKDNEVKVIILAGAGSTFSSGHDMGSPEAQEER